MSKHIFRSRICQQPLGNGSITWKVAHSSDFDMFSGASERSRLGDSDPTKACQEARKWGIQIKQKFSMVVLPFQEFQFGFSPWLFRVLRKVHPVAELIEP